MTCPFDALEPELQRRVAAAAQAAVMKVYSSPWHADAEIMYAACRAAMVDLVNQQCPPKHRASEAMLEALRHFVKHGPPRTEHGHPIGDWACRECRPHSDMLKEGFQCCYHAALSIIANLDSAAEGAEGKAEQ